MLKISDKLSVLVALLQKFLSKKQDEAKVVENGNIEETKQFVDFYGEFNELEKRTILEELALVQDKLEQAHVMFNFQTNFDLIESSIYYIESLESKYNYLIKRARELRLKCALKSV